MEVVYKKQRGEQSKPVVWGVQLSQEMTVQIEENAKENEIPEAEVFRRALSAYLGAPKTPSPRQLARLGRTKDKDTGKLSTSRK